VTFLRGMHRSWDRHDAASTARARAAFVELAEFERSRVEAERKREAEIAALPTVTWRGRRLYTLRCQGDFGKGPHDMNVPESILWTLIAFRAFRCPYHS
jgi:hypothetical protein